MPALIFIGKEGVAVENRPLVSVIIPVHNTEKTLARMLTCVREQTWQHLEIIVIDDGSTDGTLALARETAEQDARITVLAQENLGVSSARNAGLNLCRGTFIYFADGDDTLPPDALERLVLRALRDGAGMVIGGYTEYIGSAARARNRANREDTVSIADYLALLCPDANDLFYGVLWNKLFRRDLTERGKVRFPEALTWGEDFSFVMTYLQQVKQVSFLRESVYGYHRSMGSASVRQVLDCVVHPLSNIRAKRFLYSRLKALYTAQGVYGAYRRRLWLYLFRVGLS